MNLRGLIPTTGNDVFSGNQLLAERTFRRRYCSRRAGVRSDGLTEGFGEGLEDGFGNVVGVAAVGDVDVEVHFGGVGEGAEGFGDQFDVEGFDFFGGEGDVEDEGGAAGEVQCDAGEGVFHGDRRPAVAEDAGLVAEGFVEGGAEDEGDVLDGVVVVDVGVAVGGDGEVE